jgi:predicted nucleic acid-binding protein
MRIFLDANILFSAAKSDGAVRRLLALLRKAKHELCADAYVVEEARRNLAVKAPDGLATLDALLPAMHIGPAQLPDAVLASSVSLPEKDLPVLQSAIRMDCDALVTGDRTHFDALYGKAIQGVTIHSPASLVQTLFP